MIISVLLYVILSWRPDIHDIALATVVPSSVAVPQGLDIRINVTVRNQGSWRETCDLNVMVSSNASAQTLSQTVTDLGVGENRIVTFVWTTRGLTLGNYRINVTAGRVVNETDMADNSLSTVLTLSKKIRLMTSMGNMTIELFDDMPVTGTNFKEVVWGRFYDGTIFHRVVEDFVVQGGNPTTGGHAAVPSIPDELPNKHSNIRGTVAMAKTSEPNSATSEFFINWKNNSKDLDPNFSVFGQVIEGMDVVDRIELLARPPPEDPEEQQDETPIREVKLLKAEFIP